MKLRVLVITLGILGACYAIRLTQKTIPVFQNQATADERQANGPGQSEPLPERFDPPPHAAPQSQLQAFLLLIEPDWSTSPTATEVGADLERALAGSALPETADGNKLQAAARILFSADQVECYLPQSCAELMAWLEKHKLIRKKVPFPEGQLKWEEGVGVGSAPPGFESNLVDAGELLPLPKLPEDAPRRPFVELRQRWKWQVHSSIPSDLIDVHSGLELFSVELGKENFDTLAQRLHLYLRIPGRRANESMFVCAKWNQYPPGGYPGMGLQEDRAFNEKSGKGPRPVIWIANSEALNQKRAEPKLRLPDRLQLPIVVHGGDFPRRVPYVLSATNVSLGRPGQPSSASADIPTASASPGTSSPPRSASPAKLSARSTSSAQSPADTANAAPRKESDRLAALRDEYQRLDARASNLAGEIATAVDAESEMTRHRQAVRAAVSEAFLAGQKLHEAELAEFRDRMQKLQELIVQRTRNSERIIDRRVDDLLDLPLKWAPPETPAGHSSASSSSDSTATAPPNNIQDEATPGTAQSASAPPPIRASRRPFPASTTVGLISEVLNDGTVVVSCKEPGEIQVGEELVLRASNEENYSGQKIGAGWIEITKLENAETAIGKPFGLTRLPVENRYVDRQPIPGDIVERPIYEQPGPAASGKQEPDGALAAQSADPQSFSELEGVWWFRQFGPGGSKQASDKQFCFAFWKDRCMIFKGKERTQTYRVTLDLTQSPHRITLDAIERGVSKHGIYMIEKNRLIISIIERTQPIPETFKDQFLQFERGNSTEFNEVIQLLKTASADAMTKRPRRKVPLTSDVGLISEVRDDGTIVVSCKEAGDVQVGEELVLSWVSKEGGGTFQPAGWIEITGLEDAATAIGRAFELPRFQIENRFVDRQPQPGDFVGRPMTEKFKATSDRPPDAPRGN